MKKIILATTIIATTLTGLNNVFASVNPIHLQRLAQSSNRILIGKVKEVISIEGVKVAQVEVIRLLKGPPIAEIYSLAQGTWTCDISEAETGETALFFFSDYQYSSNPKPRPAPDENGLIRGSSEFEEPIGFREKVEALTKGAAFQMIMHAGRGRMPLRSVEGIDYVTLWTAEVILPKSINTIPGAEPGYDFIRSAPLERTVAYIERTLKQRGVKR